MCVTNLMENHLTVAETFHSQVQPHGGATKEERSRAHFKSLEIMNV